MDNIITRNIENGMRLMEDALRMYSNGNRSLGYGTLKKAEALLKEAHDMENTEFGKDVMKYGDNLNFGALYKVFESNTARMFKDQSKHKALKDIVKCINENRVLKDQFNAYNAFTNPINVENSREYVNEASKLIKSHSKSELLENNKKLLGVMRDSGIDENVDFTDSEIGLFESVEYLITHKKGFGNLSKVNDINGILSECVDKNNRTVNESENIDAEYNKEVNALAEKYDGMLSEDEIGLVKDTQDPEKSKTMFENLKEKLTEILGKLSMSGPDSSSWKEILEKVKSKMYNASTALQDIAEFMEILGEVEDEE